MLCVARRRQNCQNSLRNKIIVIWKTAVRICDQTTYIDLYETYIDQRPRGELGLGRIRRNFA